MFPICSSAAYLSILYENSVMYDAKSVNTAMNSFNLAILLWFYLQSVVCFVFVVYFNTFTNFNK